MNFRLKHLCAGSAIVIATSACAPMAMYSQPQQPQIELTEDERRRLISRFLGGQEAPSGPVVAQPGAQMRAPVNPQANAAPSQSEQELAQRIAALPKLTTGVMFEKKRDGFSVDGVRYIDPEGPIVKYGHDNLAGDTTYLTRTGPSTFVIKYLRVAGGQEAMTIGQASNADGLWRVETSTGKKLNGQTLLMGGKGFLVARESTGFLYIPGIGIRNIAGPEAFDIAPFQNGDVVGTGFILLERRKQAESRDASPLGTFLKSVNNLAATTGMSKQEDYMLFNAFTGKSIPLNIQSTGKERSEFSNCKQVRRYIEKCANVDLVESLYGTDGSPLLTHYFWRIAWYNAAAEPILIAQENGLRDITVTSLATTSKVTVFSRTLGIAGFTTAMNREGQVSIAAKMGFSTETVSDAASLLRSGAAQPPKQ